MQEEKLTIEYEGERLKGGVNSKLDKALEKTVKEFGYILSGTGFDMDTQVRDLGFYKEAK